MTRLTIPLVWFALRIELLRVRPDRLAAAPRQKPRPATRLAHLSPHLRKDIGLPHD